jgi:hypothetical protein
MMTLNMPKVSIIGITYNIELFANVLTGNLYLKGQDTKKMVSLYNQQ